jgi:hypothetical protein
MPIRRRSTHVARLSFLPTPTLGHCSSTMTSYFPPGASTGSSPAQSPLSPPTQRSSALSNRLTSVLSASYADSDIRDALETLSVRGIHNSPETRRQLRLDVQKEVVDCNGEIVRDFGKVAEVRLVVFALRY